MVLISLWVKRRNPQVGTICFRPLAGIMVLIAETLPADETTPDGVSVPLRGLWFLSPAIAGELFPADDVVSVPLRGLWFLS